MHIFQCIHRCIHALGKWEIKWAKTASPPIHVASQYESINVSPPSGLSVNQFSPRLSALATSSSTNGLFRNGRFSKRDSPSVPWHSCVDTSSRNENTPASLDFISFRSRMTEDEVNDSMFLFKIEYFKWFEMRGFSSVWSGSCLFKSVMITRIFVILKHVNIQVVYLSVY